MLRIEEKTDGCVTRWVLSGRIQSDDIACIQSAMNDGCTHKILDLGEVTVVDIAAVRFVMRCEDDGVALANVPPYIREWFHRERAEEMEGQTV